MEPTKTTLKPVLTVFALQDGGYLVREAPDWQGNTGCYYPPLFACTTMGELLSYLKRNLGWQKKK